MRPAGPLRRRRDAGGGVGSWSVLAGVGPWTCGASGMAANVGTPADRLSAVRRIPLPLPDEGSHLSGGRPGERPVPSAPPQSARRHPADLRPPNPAEHRAPLINAHRISPKLTQSTLAETDPGRFAVAGQRVRLLISTRNKPTPPRRSTALRSTLAPLCQHSEHTLAHSDYALGQLVYVQVMAGFGGRRWHPPGPSSYSRFTGSDRAGSAPRTRLYGRDFRHASNPDNAGRPRPTTRSGQSGPWRPRGSES